MLSMIPIPTLDDLYTKCCDISGYYETKIYCLSCLTNVYNNNNNHNNIHNTGFYKELV